MAIQFVSLSYYELFSSYNVNCSMTPLPSTSSWAKTPQQAWPGPCCNSLFWSSKFFVIGRFQAQWIKPMISRDVVLLKQSNASCWLWVILQSSFGAGKKYLCAVLLLNRYGTCVSNTIYFLVFSIWLFGVWYFQMHPLGAFKNTKYTNIKY